MNEYHGIRYLSVGLKKWRVTFPSGYKSVIEAESEDELKQKIDDLRAQMGT